MRKVIFTSISTIGTFYLVFIINHPVTATQQHITSRHIAPKVNPNLIAASPVKNGTVTIDGFQFKPNNIVLKKGGKITFINKDFAPHTVTPEKGAKFTGTGRLLEGETTTIVFNTVGIQKYFCDIHPSMKGRITVVK